MSRKNEPEKRAGKNELEKRAGKNEPEKMSRDENKRWIK